MIHASHRAAFLVGAAGAATTILLCLALALRVEGPAVMVAAGLIVLSLLGAAALCFDRPELAVLCAALSLLPVGAYTLGSPGAWAGIGAGNVVLLCAASFALWHRGTDRHTLPDGGN